MPSCRWSWHPLPYSPKYALHPYALYSIPGMLQQSGLALPSKITSKSVVNVLACFLKAIDSVIDFAMPSASSSGSEAGCELLQLQHRHQRRYLFLFCSEHCLLVKRAVSLVACFFEGEWLSLFGVNGRRGWGAKSCVRLEACLCDECVTSLPCPVSPGLWRRAGRKREPVRAVRRNWDFGGRLFGTRGPDNLPPKSQFRRTAQTGSLFLPALRHRANGMATERHQSGGTMRRRLDDVFSMDRRASVRAEDGPGRMMRGPKRLGSTTGFSGAKFAQKTRERLRRRMLRSSEDLLSKKGAMRKMEICGPNFCQIFTDLQISNPSDPMSTCFSGWCGEGF